MRKCVKCALTYSRTARKRVTFNGKFSNGDGGQSQKRVRSAVWGRQKIFFRSEWLDTSGISVATAAPPFRRLNAAKNGSNKHKGALKNRYVAAEFKTKPTGVGLDHEIRYIKISRCTRYPK